MQNKSEMINRIAELAEENAKLNAIIDGYQPRLQALKDENYGLNQELLGYKKGVQAAEIIELKAENERLKAEIKNNKSAYQVELGTYNMECGNLLEENKQLLQTLQEIKEYINAQGIDNKWNMRIQRFRSEILQILTKAEEE